LRVKSDAESLNSASGALRVDGGVGIGGKLNVGGNTDVSATLTVDNLSVESLTATRVPFVGTGSTLTDDSNLTYDGTDATGGLSITNTTNTTSTTTGALKVSGGVGIAKSVYIGDDIHIPDGKNIFFGTDDDLLITHDGSNAAINNGTGNLNITGATTFANAVTVTSGGIDVTAGGIDVTAGGLTVSAGGLTVSAGGADITGIVTANNALNVTGGLTVSTGGATLNEATVEDLDENDGGVVFTNASGKLLNSAKLEFNDSTGVLTVDNDIIAFSGSDLRLKTNINPIADALNKVKSISGNTFEWNENSNHEGQDTGVIAQEIEALGLPGIIKERGDGYLGVRYEKLIPLLIEAIKELSDKVDSLEERLNN
jgi:hypothetical protein